MIDEKNVLGRDSKEQEVDFIAIFFKYFFYWRWFAVSIFICCAAAFVYLKYQAPIYEISSSVLIKEDKKRGPYSQSANSTMSVAQDLGMLSMTSNFENEIEILQSRTLVKKVVNDLNLYVKTYKTHMFGYDIPLYKNSPLHVFMAPQEAELLKSPITLDLAYNISGKLKVQVLFNDHGDEKCIEEDFEKLPAVLPTSVGVITISRTDTTKLFNDDVNLISTIYNPTAASLELLSNLSIQPIGKRTTIARVSFKNNVKERGVDFVNTLIANYNQDANNEKNEVAQKTADFIQERIGIINRELGSTESKLADFKQKSGLTNLTSDAQMALQESSKYEQQRTENATQISLVQFLSNYINDPINKDEVLPANVGLKDQGLTSIIDQYNAMIIERKRLLRTSSENNPAVIHMNTGIDAMRRNVRTSVNSVLKGLQITRTDIERQASKFETRISNAPKQEKEFMSISRQQEIQAALYIMLLEKREENAITLASTANNGRIIEDAMASSSPVAPRKGIFLIAAFIIGCIIPIIIILIKEILRYKIENIADIEGLTELPIIGELPLSNAIPVEGAIMLRENKNDLMEETFRSFRTNLLFMLEENEKVILFTSTIPTEGKSFAVGNLAVSMAYLGKKILVIGLDIRKPGLNKVFNLSSHRKGITDYLNDPENVKLSTLIQHSDLSPNLDILVGGTIPPNPTELVARNSLDEVIKDLKKQYDYILLDTAPIAMVTDTAIISRVADMCVYVCRADVTPKNEFQYVNILNEDKKFKKLAVVLNGTDLSKRQNSYAYGYGKYGNAAKYGYGSKYGYSKRYGYGYGNDN